MDPVIVLTTLPIDAERTATFARTLVEEGLAACVNVLPPMESIYRWQGTIHTDPEQQLIIKTVSTRLDDLKARIAALHPYEVPELLVLSVTDGSDAYLAWLRQSVSIS